VSDDFIISDTHLKQAYSSFALLCYANSAVKSRLRGKTCKGEKNDINIYYSQPWYILAEQCVFSVGECGFDFCPTLGMQFITL